MAQSYIQATYQVVFATKFRQPTLLKPLRKQLFAYLSGILRKDNCTVHEVGGVDDHVHLVFDLHPSVALSDLVKRLKLGAHTFIDENRAAFPGFIGWQRGYGAFTYASEAIPNLIAYVQNQEHHHQKVTSAEELRKLLIRHNIPYNEIYFE